MVRIESKPEINDTIAKVELPLLLSFSIKLLIGLFSLIDFV